jgi:hypothetical protein
VCSVSPLNNIEMDVHIYAISKMTAHSPLPSPIASNLLWAYVRSYNSYRGLELVSLNQIKLATKRRPKYLGSSNSDMVSRVVDCLNVSTVTRLYM